MDQILILQAYFLVCRDAQYTMAGERKKRYVNGRYSPHPRTIARLMKELGLTRQGVLRLLSEEETQLKANPGALIYRKF